MNDKRDLLKKLAGVSAAVTMLPNSWVKPLISSVVLPAHSQTSISSCSEQDIIGDWAEVNSELSAPLILTLQSGGEGINATSSIYFPTLKWNQNGVNIEINLFGDNSGTINEVNLIGKINSACTRISGNLVVPPMKIVGRFTLFKS